jgi:hypothetical protein
MTTEVHFTTRNWKEIVQKSLGKDAAKPDVVYEFSNGRRFESTDNTEHGIYED